MAAFTVSWLLLVSSTSVPTAGGVNVMAEATVISKLCWPVVTSPPSETYWKCMLALTPRLAVIPGREAIRKVQLPASPIRVIEKKVVQPALRGSRQVMA